jgi:hypothetical protein
MLEIRPYRPEDRAGVRHVCVETAYLGSSMRPHFRHSETIADILTAYYTDCEPESAWVVSDGARVLGYVLGCLDSRKAPSMEWVAVKCIFKRWLWLRPGNASFCFRSLYDMLRYAGEEQPKVDHALWPAHSHINLLPEARVGTMGMRLFRTWLTHAKQHGANGLWGISTVENTVSTLFHRAMGFRQLGGQFTALGHRLPEGGPTHLQFWVREL